MNLQDLFRQIGGIFRWWVIVAPWEQAVRVRLGKHVLVLNAGVHLRIPFADRVFLQSTRRRFTSVPTQTISTMDGKAVTVSGCLGYRIDDIGRLYDTLHQPEDVLQTEAQAAVARFVAGHTLQECGPGAVEAFVADSLDLSKYGLGGTEYYVTDFVAVRTFRLISGEPKNWTQGLALDTATEDGIRAS
jgi:hypothetical protein